MLILKEQKRRFRSVFELEGEQNEKIQVCVLINSVMCMLVRCQDCKKGKI